MNCKPGEQISVQIGQTDELKGEKMVSKQIDFPVISTDDAIQALRQFSKSSCLYKRKCLDTLRILNVQTN